MTDVSPKSGQVPSIVGGPEAMFRVGGVGGTSARATGMMDSGLWACDGDGAPTRGALGVLVDVVWGGAAVACAPPGRWGVTTELSVTFGAPLPVDGSRFTATGTVVHQGVHSALTTGSVTMADGRLLAAGMQRTRFVAEVPPSHPSLPADPGVPLSGTLPELLGLRRAADTLALTVTEALVNPAGNLHGGILFALAELAATRAVGARAAGLAAELLSILYLRPSRVGDEIRCATEVVRQGTTAATAIVRCVGVDERVRALATLQYGPVEVPNR